MIRQLKDRLLLRSLRHARKYGKPAPPPEAFAFDQTVFLGYDPAHLEKLQALVPKGRQAKAGFITDFIGVRTRLTSLPSSSAALGTAPLGLPLPNDYLAEAAEWIALARAVEAATEPFTMMELGAGWGPWIVAGGHLARGRGIKDIRLLGVEADEAHFATMRDHFLDNGFDPEAHTLLLGAAGTAEGEAQWAIPEEPSEAWGHRPFDADGAGASNAADSSYRRETVGDRPLRTIPVYDVKELIARQSRWTLIHIDIQGWEAEVIEDALGPLGERVERLAIGTHSRQIEARLLSALHGAGWVLEAEKPCKFNQRLGHESFEAMTYVDGFQSWRNPALSEA